MNLLARQPGVRHSFVQLGPEGASFDLFPGQKRKDSAAYNDLISRMQRLRGRVYLKDGAIRISDLTADGRHISLLDESSWHLLTVGAEGHVLGCARFQAHPASVSYENLSIKHAAIAKSPEWGPQFRNSVETEIALARTQSFFWLEMGGWALSEELRGTTEALLYALFTYAWSQAIGGAIGVTTATERNGSASILRRLGGESLYSGGVAIPAYYDERYRCVMEVLRFDSRFPMAKYRSTVEALRIQIANVPVIGAGLVSNPKVDGPCPKIPAQSAGYWTKPQSNFAVAAPSS